MLAIAIDRDSVHAGDDLSGHASSIKLDPTATLRALFEAIQTMHYLPCIKGDEATWVISASGKQIGVLAQQWTAPKLVVSLESLVKQVFGEHEPRLLFKYWCQTNPDVVFSRIEAGELLPSRY
ncbi:hypothetical protein G7027_22590 [Pseudomonas japonica]|nr:hypothetical protein [Pseudomonas japonica]MBA1291437.1 hypothetical protein [Pseudomonas japonica]